MTTSRSTSDHLRRFHEQFLAEQRHSARRSPATLRAYRDSFALLLSLMPTLRMEQLAADTLTEFFRRLDTRLRLIGGQERKGVTASTIASHRSRLGRFFSWLVTKGVIRVSPFEGIPYPRVEYDIKQYIGKHKVERIFAALLLARSRRTRFQRTRDVALFATLLYTGIRRGELLALQLLDVNLERLEVSIRAATSKSRTGRVIPINSTLCSALEDYLAERRKLPLATPQLFVTSAGDRLTLYGLIHLTRRVIARSGVRFHLHQFRHTFAVNFLNSSGDVAKLRQLLGHRDIRMTSGYLRNLPTSAMRTNIETLGIDTLL